MAKKAPKKKATKRRGAKQGELPGFERPRDEELDAAAEDVNEADALRGKYQEQGEGARMRLLDLMRKKGLSTYVSEDRRLRVDIKAGHDKVSVKKWEPPPPPPEDEAKDEAAE